MAKAVLVLIGIMMLVTICTLTVAATISVNLSWFEKSIS